MAHLYKDMSIKSLYSDRSCLGGKQEWKERIQKSCTLYIGNLSFYSTEEQLYELFGRCGTVRRIIMGLDRFTKTPCGFCFVEYNRRDDTEAAVQYIAGLKLDDRIIRVDWDGGFVEGRQYGRGRSGGQVRDEYRADYDEARGGWGKAETPEAAAANRRRPFTEPIRRESLPMRSRPVGGHDMSPRDAPSGAPRQPDTRDDQPAKRSKVEPTEANPRFREDREDDDEDD